MRVMSWVWKSAGGKDSEDDVEEGRFQSDVFANDADKISALQIEWCKAWARVRRWDEEVRLVQEEVRRAGVTLEHRAREWEERARSVPVGTDEWEDWRQGSGEWTLERAEGAVAYALKQAAMMRDVANRITVSMTEERRGRGKKRRLVHDQEWVDLDDGHAGEAGGGEEDELADLRADEVADDDFILGGGEDED